MNYVEIMRKFIEDLGKKEFTHRDVINVTGTNCPYAVVKYLKKYYDIEYTDVEKSVKTINTDGIEHTINRKYRKFYVIGRKEQCRKT